MPDFSQVAAALEAEGKATPTAQAWAAHQQRARMVAVQFDELVTFDAWATYRKHVEALLAAVTADLAAITARLVSVEVVGTALLKDKLVAARLAGAEDAYQTVLALPELVRGQGTTATAAPPSGVP